MDESLERALLHLAALTRDLAETAEASLAIRCGYRDRQDFCCYQGACPFQRPGPDGQPGRLVCGLDEGVRCEDLEGPRG